MINSKALSELLRKSLQNGIDLIFIANLSGEILAKEGVECTSTITDVVSSIWTEYNEIGEIIKEEKLTYLIIENEDCYIIATRLYGYIITIKANPSNNLGMLKIHLESIAKYLHEKFADFKNTLIERA